MAVYSGDSPEYLDNALKSIWHDQTIKPNEIILIQDGPINESLENTINRWVYIIGPALTLIVNKENLGLTKSLNKGLTFCTGNFIARMDSDDISLPNRFELQLKFFNDQPEIEVLGGAMIEFNDNKKLNVRSYPTHMSEIKRRIHVASPLCHPSVMFRRTIFERGFLYNDNLRTSQDIDLWFRLVLNGVQIANINEPLILFRINDNFYSRRSYKKAWSEFKVYFFRGIELNGFNTRLFYSFFRLFFRFLPTFLTKKLYTGKFRGTILKQNHFLE